MDNCFYIKKTATSTWEVYGKYSEVWGTAIVHSLSGEGVDYNGITITWNMTNLSALPSNTTQVSYIGNVGWASSAAKLATARTITLSGAVTGSVSFDGSTNVTIATAVNHTHNYAGSASAGGSANSAVKLDTATAGSSTLPVYFTGGKPVQCNSTLGVSITGTAANATKWNNYENDIGTNNTSDTWLLVANNNKIQHRLSTSFAAAGHTHNYAGSSSAGGSANSALVLIKNSTFNDASTGRLSYYDADISNTTNNAAWSAPSSGWHQIYHNDLSVSNYWTELAFPVNDTNGLAWRQRRNGSYFGWYRILDTNNYTSYTVTKTGSGASGTWGISVSGSSASCTGNAATATKLATARTISLTGSVTGSGTFDGSGNLSITTTTNHTHSQYLPLAGGTMTGNITYSAKGSSYIGNGSNDAANMVGGALNNLVISSWNGISFSTSCTSQTYTNKNAVSIDCRNGILAAASLRVGNGSGSTINFCTNGGTAAPGAKIVAYSDRIEFVFA